jgi:hypothetical protein
MKTYYIRHTKDMDVDAKTFQTLWDERRIGIHFPKNIHGRLPRRGDNRSLDPDDYRHGKGAMRRLTELAKHGGYVCAEYFGHNECVVARVKPRSRIKLIHGMWGSKNGHEGRKAILKSLPLEKVKYIRPSDSALILVGRPQQGTIMRWRRAGKIIENIVRGKRATPSLESLSPDQQEIMCAEFLRSANAAKRGLPQLVHLILPVGRTMRGIDIYGIGQAGKRIFAQVTYRQIEDCDGKLDALRQYRGDDGDALLLFCDCQKLRSSKGVKIVPLRMVYDSFVATSTGKLWFERATVHVGAQR